MEELLFKTKGVKALVVDDNSVNLMIGSNILRQYDMEVDEADSGTLAIQMYYNNRYDIILMDYRMPDMDGIEITKKICDFNTGEEHAVIVALSANVTQDITEAFLRAGAKGVMAKPIEIRELSRILRKWIPKEKRKKSEGEVIMLQEDRNERCMELMQLSFHKVQDLDWKNVLLRMNGTMEHYVKILNVGYGNIVEQMLCIEREEKKSQPYDVKPYDAKPYDVKPYDAKLYFHSLNGIFSNLGAFKLSEDSKKLERNPALYDSHYIQKVNRFLKQLKEALTLYEDILAVYPLEQDVQVMSKYEYWNKLEHLKEYIQRFEFNECLELAERLMWASEGRNRGYLNEVLEAIEIFMYEEALERLKKVMIEE